MHMIWQQLFDQRVDQIQEQLVNRHQHLEDDALILAMEDRAEDAAVAMIEGGVNLDQKIGEDSLISYAVKRDLPNVFQALMRKGAFVYDDNMALTEALKKSTAEFAIKLIKGGCHLTWEHWRDCVKLTQPAMLPVVVTLMKRLDISGGFPSLKRLSKYKVNTVLLKYPKLKAVIKQYVPKKLSDELDRSLDSDHVIRSVYKNEPVIGKEVAEYLGKMPGIPIASMFDSFEGPLSLFGQYRRSAFGGYFGTVAMNEQGQLIPLNKNNKEPEWFKAVQRHLSKQG
ncbi:MAG: hypothetical protein VXW87_00595 [Pseudomonadota bacterium]|nr:hypothetical protein [Pseudomonadota bacterium]